MTLMLNDNQLVSVDGTNGTFYDYEGIFLSIHQDFMPVSSLGNMDELREIYKAKYSNIGPMDILDLSVTKTSCGCPAVVFLAKESLPGKPTAYFGCITVSLDDENNALTIVLWTQEDEKDNGVRDKHVMGGYPHDNDTSQSQVSDPLDSMYDDVFVFHALSMLRRRLYSLPHALSISR